MGKWVLMKNAGGILFGAIFIEIQGSTKRWAQLRRSQIHPELSFSSNLSGRGRLVVTIVMTYHKAIRFGPTCFPETPQTKT